MRKAELTRKTRETDIELKLDLDGSGKNSVDTGVGFLNHMLELFSVHSGVDLCVCCKGDTEVDFHHSVEDVGICLGQAFKTALGDKKGIARFADRVVPMDECAAMVAIDISGRPFLVFQADFPEERAGGYDTCMTEEFFRALSTNAGITLHLRAEYGKNSHHIAEALYKAAAHALRLACTSTGSGVLSTKGSL